MASFEIRFAHRFGPDELRERAERFARSAEERYKTLWHWEGDTLRIRTPSDTAYAASAALVAGPDEVSVHVTMPPALLPMRAMLERDLRWALERTFGVSLTDGDA
ncbi:MAG TPA: polyhydroxyalkanoic acid system family protein [Polyangiaceae bacterium]|nr:polyhydroxyalkanoic acid system family protein [Polyangiaceae bacterium]